MSLDDAFLQETSGGRKQYPRQEINAEQDLARLIESITDYAIFMLDVSGRVVSWNAGAERIKGYRADEIIGKHFSCFYTAEDAAKGKPAKVLDIAAREGRYTEECLRVRKDGSLFRADVIIAPLREETGQLRGFSKITRDVTAVHLAQKNLADTSCYTQAILDRSPVGIMTLKASGEFVTANPAICRLIGASQEQLRALNFRQLETWRSSGLLALAEGALATRAPSHGEVHVITTFGKELWVQAQFVTLSYKDEPHLLVIFEDITERKRMVAAIAESESLFRTVMNSVSSEIAVLDAKGSIIAVNEAWQRFGRDNGGSPDVSLPIGKSYLSVCERAIGTKNDESALAATEGIRSVLDGARSHFNLEYPCHSPSGQRWYHMSVRPMARISGGVVVAHENVTGRKQAEQALEESERHLRGVVNAAPFGAHIYEIRPDGRFVMVETNLSADTILGIDNSFLIGKTPEEAFPALTGTDLPAIYRRVAELGIEYRADRIDYSDQVISGSFEVHATQVGPNRMAVFFRSTTDLVRAYDETLAGWSRAMEYRDKETEGHTRRVTEMTLRLAAVLGIIGTELMHMRWGALLHDVGKLAVPDSILFKRDKLTEEEWVVMRRHPEFAYQMLSPVKFLHPALEIPYCHHEKWDGTGYPRGLTGETIPLSARIFAVADVWDALRSDRPYHQGWSVESVTEHISSLAGTHFDPRAVEAFRSLRDGL